MKPKSWKAIYGQLDVSWSYFGSSNIDLSEISLLKWNDVSQDG